MYYGFTRWAGADQVHGSSVRLQVTDWLQVFRFVTSDYLTVFTTFLFYKVTSYKYIRIIG
ncbi:hypothetical protein SeF2_073 [Salmonella phage SeF2]|uniref:Uncharacterized protein n=1 Tax=Salmonella phage PMBT19 TaxID=3229743 RepID=A0AB39C096_9CAUD|nr:hypothetical protein SeF2_073 [Salmonella phage SeF2]